MNTFFKPTFVSWVSRANPVVKLIVILILFFITIFTHSLDFAIYQAILYISLLFMFSGYAPWKILIIMIPFVITFVSSSSSMIVFGKGEQIWWEWGVVKISEESFHRGLHLGFKSVSFAAQGVLFVLTTSSVSLFYAFMQKLKFPPKLAYSFMASIRLLPIVWEEIGVRRQALKVRGVKQRGRVGMFRLMQLYAVPLLAQSIRRAHRTAIAMESKHFNHRSQSRTYYYHSSYTIYDVVFVLICTIGLGAAYVATTAYPLFQIVDVRYH